MEMNFCNLFSILKEVIEEFKNSLADVRSAKISSFNYKKNTLKAVLIVVDAILQKNLKKSNYFRKFDYWNFFKETLSENKMYMSYINNTELSLLDCSNIESCRIFIKRIFLDKVLAEILQSAAGNEKCISRYYESNSIWFKRDILNSIINLLYDTDFDYNPTDYIESGFDKDWDLSIYYKDIYSIKNSNQSSKSSINESILKMNDLSIDETCRDKYTCLNCLDFENLISKIYSNIHDTDHTSFISTLDKLNKIKLYFEHVKNLKSTESQTTLQKRIKNDTPLKNNQMSLKQLAVNVLLRHNCIILDFIKKTNEPVLQPSSINTCQSNIQGTKYTSSLKDSTSKYDIDSYSNVQDINDEKYLLISKNYVIVCEKIIEIENVLNLQNTKPTANVCLENSENFISVQNRLDDIIKTIKSNVQNVYINDSREKNEDGNMFSSLENDSTDSDSFTVIKDDEIKKIQNEIMNEPRLKCKYASVINATALSINMVPQNTLLFKHVYIQAGYMYAIPIRVSDINTNFEWKFNTQTHTIWFKITYYDENSIESTTILEKCECFSAKTYITGNLKPLVPGIYTLFFENTLSRILPKVLNLYITFLRTSA
ncbi:hypothetical protein A3Q56_00266 [Intoshia linei]|uniref:GOLD domain-containing protein n=1 Tax=Intoshia linei TaxID=1819745 RepID=A0A177BCK8_9BILA|nr:hypothetical protein A3Q56_00266 [Intoshia linei]